MKDIQIAGRPLRVTATTGILNSPILLGVLCAASTAGTITIADSPNGVLTTELNAMPLTAGQYLALNMRLTGNVTITVGGTLDCTFLVAL